MSVRILDRHELGSERVLARHKLRSEWVSSRKGFGSWCYSGQNGFCLGTGSARSKTHPDLNPVLTWSLCRTEPEIRSDPKRSLYRPKPIPTWNLFPFRPEQSNFFINRLVPTVTVWLNSFVSLKALSHSVKVCSWYSPSLLNKDVNTKFCSIELPTGLQQIMSYSTSKSKQYFLSDKHKPISY